MSSSNIHIAVLPFKVMSNRRNLEYLGEGLSEFIISKLSMVDGLRLSSSTSSFRFKNSSISLKEISEALQVNAIVEGSINIVDQDIKIFTSLIDPVNDHILWSHSREDLLKNIISLQDQISTDITEKLRENFWHFDFFGFDDQKKGISTDAFLCCLKGQYLYKKWNETDVNKAIECFNSALEYDEKYADPLIGLANCYVFLGGTGYMKPTEAFKKVNDYCDKARTIAPDSSDLDFTIGGKYFWQDWQLKKAFKTLNQVLESNPSHSESHTVLSLIYVLIGNTLQANKHINIALRLDPFSPNKLFTKGWIAYLSNDYELATKYCNQALKYSPKLMPAVVIKCCAQIMSGEAKAVEQFLKTSINSSEDETTFYGILGLCHANLGQLKELDLCKERLAKTSTDRSVAFQFLIYAASEDSENAIKWLNRAFEQKIPLLLFLIVDPLITPISHETDFIKLKSRLIELRWDGLKTNEPDHMHTKKTWSVADVKLVLDYMENEQPYLDPEVSVRKIANETGIHYNKLSALINEEFGKNFNEFINGYRVELFKERVVNKKYNHLSILGLAFECGFNSKSSFNNTFKRLTGITPKAYKNSI